MMKKTFSVVLLLLVQWWVQWVTRVNLTIVQQKRVLIWAFLKVLAKEVASRGITVNVVAPGFYRNRYDWSAYWRQKAGILGNVPAGRLGEPKDIAKAVAFLASDDAAYITGTTLHVNGGLYMS